MEITLDIVLRVLRKSLLHIVLFALIAGVAAFLACGFLVQPTYVSTTEINLIGNENAAGGTTAEGNNSWVFANRLLKTCAGILDTRNFAMKIKAEAGIDYMPSYSISYEEETTIIRISVSDHNPENAYKIAQAIANNANSHLAETTLTSVSVVVIDNPILPTQASSPNTLSFTVLSAVAAAAIVIVVQVLREVLGTKVKDESELRKRYNIPVLASIPNFNEAVRNSSKYSYTDYYVKGEN